MKYIYSLAWVADGPKARSSGQPLTFESPVLLVNIQLIKVLEQHCLKHINAKTKLERPATFAQERMTSLRFLAITLVHTEADKDEVKVDKKEEEEQAND